MVKPEILAPCGTPEAFDAALSAGADAVYLAGDRFGARAYAGNFSEDVLLSTLERAHLFGVKVYLTVNTLFKNEELSGLYDYIKPFYMAGLDAVLVQDFGVSEYLKKHFPLLPIHMSTQMNITSLEGVKFAKDMGADRVVMDREITLSELIDIKKNCDIEIEAFVHGAMCFSYSGRCLISSYAGGRSGNRGRCAQPCRKPYTVNGSEGYIMSMKDMCTLSMVPELIDAGIDSLKIEGRMKNAAYVAAVVSAYKEIRDDYMEGKPVKEKAAQLEERLREVFSRGGFTRGYLNLKSRAAEEISRASLIHAGRQGHSGVVVGTVKASGGGMVDIRLDRELNKGDELLIVIQDKEIRLTSNVNASKGEMVRLNSPHTKDIVKGSRIIRLRNAEITEEINKIINTERKIPVNGYIKLKTGERAAVGYKVADNTDNFVTETGEVVLPAAKTPVSDEILKKCLAKLGDTDFILNDFIIENDNSSFIPMSELNKLRRRGIEKLRSAVTGKYLRSETGEQQDYTAEINRESGSGLFISVSNPDQLRQVTDFEEISGNYKLFIDTAQGMTEAELKECMDIYKKEGGKSPVLMLPYTYSIHKDKWYNNVLPEFDSVYIRNIDDLASIYNQIKERKSGLFKYIYVGASLYAYNDAAVLFLYNTLKEAADKVYFESPYELNHNEAAGLTYPGNSQPFRHIYGRIPVMITAAYAARTGEKQVVDDKLNSFFIIPNADLDYNVILNGKADCLFNEKTDEAYKLISFTNETESEVKNVLRMFVKEMPIPASSFTKGHFNRGIE